MRTALAVTLVLALAGVARAGRPRLDRLAAALHGDPSWKSEDRRRFGELLADATGDDGRVDLVRLGARGGLRAVALARALARRPAGDPLLLRRVGLLGGPNLLQRLYRVAPVSRPRMRAVDGLVARFGAGRPLAGLDVIGLQHLLGSTGGLLRALAASGVPAERIAVIGKTYSEHPLVARELRWDGFTILPAHAREAERRSTPDWLRAVQVLLPGTRDAATEEVLLRRLRQPGRLLLLDDGGALILLVNRLVARHPELAGKIVAVEQTSRGIARLAGVTLRFPVIDVARSWAKTTYEAPLIGRSVVTSVEAHLAELARRHIPFGRRVLVVGYGAVGRAIARELKRRGIPVVAYDPREGAGIDAEADGIALFRDHRRAFPHGEVVISATGEIAVTRANLGLLPDGAILFNAGSHQTEIEQGLVQPGLTFHGVDVTRLTEYSQPTRGWAVLGARGRRYLLAANGGVVNFGGVDPIPARYIQLTRGLLYLGALQAARATTPGIQALAERPQRDLVADVQADLARRGESLDRPRF